MTTRTNLTVQVRLDVVDQLLRTHCDDLTGVWPRVAAWLLRLALEDATNAFCGARTPVPPSTPWRAKWIALAAYLPGDEAQRASALWYALSRVAHHHAYELPPTVDELRSWYRDADEVCRALELAGQRLPRS